MIHAKAPDDFWRFMVIAGFYSGQRMGDLIRLTWGSVDFTANVIRLTTGKTGRSMQIPIAAGLRKVLLDRYEKTTAHAPIDFVWPEQASQYEAHGAGAFSNAFYEILALAGLGISPRVKARRQGRP